MIGRRYCWSLLWLSMLSACERGRERPTGAPALAKRAELTQAAGRADELRRELALVRQRFDVPLRPASSGERERCPDELLPRGEHRVIVRVRDVRSEAKTLLPLALRASLETDEFSRLGTHFSAGAAALWDEDRLQPRNEVAATAALAELKALLTVRFLAELRIESYSTPRLFRRKAAPRSEWAAGQLGGQFVVHDLSEGRVLCHAPLLVRGDARDAPVRRRLREATRQRLERELQESVWQEMRAAISSVSSVLKMPPASERDDAAHRWAAALTSDARAVQSTR